MNITNEDYKSIQRVVDILVKHEDSLTEEEQEYLHDTQCVLDELEEKRIKDNIRKAKQIAEKRKLDPTYAGGYSYRKKGV